VSSERPPPLASHAPPAYTKPKKNKHKRKKNKLAFLTFYKVDDSGKVTRLRKECPSPECGAGVFMANHFDRHYCGKCGLTYVYEADSAPAPKPKGKPAPKVEEAAPAGAPPCLPAAVCPRSPSTLLQARGRRERSR